MNNMMTLQSTISGRNAARLRSLIGPSGLKVIVATAVSNAADVVRFRWMPGLAHDTLPIVGGLRPFIGTGTAQQAHFGCWSQRGKGTAS